MIHLHRVRPGRRAQPRLKWLGEHSLDWPEFSRFFGPAKGHLTSWAFSGEPSEQSERPERR